MRRMWTGNSGHQDRSDHPLLQVLSVQQLRDETEAAYAICTKDAHALSLRVEVPEGGLNRRIQLHQN